jgi:hypothetical protein
MVKWDVTIYETLTELETAIESIDNTVNIHIIPIFKDNRQQYMLAVGDELSVIIDGGDA